MSALGRWVATGGGAGFFPVAPGTAGSLLAVALYCWVPGLPLGSRGGIGPAEILFLLLVFLLGLPAAGGAEREFGKDGGPIVVDEIVGQWIALAGIAPSPAAVIGGFLLFRAADIVKPFPAGRSQRLPGGLGVMADDAIAGLYAALLLRLLLRFLPAGRGG